MLENFRGSGNSRKGELEFDEVERAKIYWIKKTQYETFNDEIKSLQDKKCVRMGSKIGILYPKLDEFGVLRANSRIERADFVNYNSKYPIILPRGHIVTQLIVRYYHEKGNHTRGINGLLADISANF